jgi:hypothetical protein
MKKAATVALVKKLIDVSPVEKLQRQQSTRIGNDWKLTTRFDSLRYPVRQA